jgi:cytoskeleton-associated protein 5
MLCLIEDEQVLLPEMETLVEALINKLEEAFLAQPISIRMYKYLLNTIHKLINKPGALLWKAIPKATLQRLIGTLLEHISDMKFNQLEDDGPYIARPLNVLSMNLLDLDFTLSLETLLQLLRTAIPTGMDGVATGSPRSKFIEYIMKCLLRTTKELHNHLNSIDIAVVLREIHLFLEAHPPAKWRAIATAAAAGGNGGADDMPLRTIKTLLNELVTLKGNKILSFLSNYTNGDPSMPPPAILSYIQLMLRSQQAATSSSSTTGSSSVQQQQPQQVTETKTILAEIFKKIGVKETTQEGLMELYRFQRDHPSIDIEPHLQRTSSHFQTYIKRGLEKIQNQQSQVENRGISTT